MSQLSKSDVVKRSSFTLAGLGVVLVAGSYLQTVIRVDPFAQLKETSKSIDKNLGVRIEGIELKSFEKGKLMTEAKMDRLDIGQDRQQYELYGVREGVFYSKKGKLQFEAPRAQWNVPTHELQAPTGGTLKSKDFNLKVSDMVFKNNIVNTLGSVAGKFYKGDLNVKGGVRFDVDKELVRTGPVKWKGPLAINFQDSDRQDPRTWQFDAPGGMHNKDGEKDVMVYEGGRAWDGELIVSAKVIEHNRKTDVITAIGDVRYISRKVNMDCDKAVIDRRIKKATMTGKVQMLFKPKDRQNEITSDEQVPPFRPIVPNEIARDRPPAPGQKGQTPEQKKLIDQIRSSKNVRDYPALCYADQVEYWYKEGDRHAIITGSPQARQDLPEDGWRQIWAHKAYYNGENDRLKMESTESGWETRMVNSLGDDVQSRWIEVSTKEDDDYFRGGPSKGTLVDYGDEVPRDKRPADGRTPPPPVKQDDKLKGNIDDKKTNGDDKKTTGGG